MYGTSETLARGPELDCVELLGTPNPLLGGKGNGFSKSPILAGLDRCFPRGKSYLSDVSCAIVVCINGVVYTHDVVVVIVAAVAGVIVEG